MTEPSNELATRTADTTVDTRRPTIDSWAAMAAPVFHLASQIADTEFVPKAMQGNAPAVAAAILHGRELGLGPMTALAQTHVIEGRSSISAEGQRAQVLSAGHELEFLESTGAVCRVRGRRRGSDHWTVVEWTIDAARAAGLTSKFNWKSYPRRMLQARASAELCQMIFPDVLHGIAATEELEDLAAENVGAAVQTTSQVARKRKADPTPQQGAGRPAAPAPAEPALSGEAEPPSGRTRQGSPQAAGDGTSSGAGGEQSAPAVSSSAPEPDFSPPDPPRRQPPPADPPREREPVDQTPVQIPITKRQVQMLLVLWKQLGVEDRDERLAYTSVMVDRTVDSTNDLLKSEASGLINGLSKLGHDVIGNDATLDQLDEVTQRRLRQALEAEVARIQDARAGE